MHVRNLFVVSLASVEEAGHLVGGAWSLLRTEHRWHELGDLGGVVLLVDHVVAHDQIWEALLADADVVEDLVNVRLTDHFVASQN